MGPETKLPEEVKNLVIKIETLEDEVKFLQQKKAELVNEINEPIYKAKAEGEKIIAEAEEKAKDLISNGDETRKAQDNKANNMLKSAEDAMTGANKRIEESKIVDANLNNKIADFTATKQSFQAECQNSKREADTALAKALELNARLKTLKITLDTKESSLNRKGDEVKESISKLEKITITTKGQLDEITKKEKSVASQLEEISPLKTSNETILKEITTQKETLAKEKEANKSLVVAIDEKEKKSDENSKARTKANATELDSISNERAKLTEEVVSLNEMKRMNTLLDRRVSEKIDRLKTLRKEQA